MRSHNTGICKLCDSPAILCYSHIIPEMCYGASYDNKHRAIKLTSDKKHHRPLQKGIRQYLLCGACEGRLNDDFEKPFYKYWYGTPALPEKMSFGWHMISGFDYMQFKLFHLSILWRASVCTLPEFNSVNLGPYEDKIRLMLLAGDAGPIDHYPIFGIVLVDEYQQVIYELVTKPQLAKPDGVHAYYLSYAGCDWYFLLTDHLHSELRNVLPLVPQLNGTLRLLAQDWTQSRSVKAFLEDRSRQNSD